jgi:peptide/nickel transport system permease protein
VALGSDVEASAGAPPGAIARALRQPLVVIALVVVAAWVVVVMLGNWVAPYGAFEASGPRLQSPNGSHWMGTDSLGRDVFSRVLLGARQSLPSAVGVIIGAVAVGSALGAAAGYLGGFLDKVVMRISDVTMGFPPILLAMAITAALGPGLRNAAIGLVAVWWPIYARLLRAQILSVKHREHIDAAVSIGATRWRILRRHVLPLSFTPTLVNATMDFGQVVILLASLSFLGLGALPPSPEWGAMITDGAKNFYQWWIAVAPGVAMLSVVLAFNFLGDGLRDALDPKESGR